MAKKKKKVIQEKANLLDAPPEPFTLTFHPDTKDWYALSYLAIFYHSHKDYVVAQKCLDVADSFQAYIEAKDAK